MPEKAEDPESKKECPSCGLGVPADAMVCEFCGWDFEEEDEWIVQIEKLERDLLLEKQKFKPGTVDHMIESSLRTPATDFPETTNDERVREPTPHARPEPSAPTKAEEEPEAEEQERSEPVAAIAVEEPEVAPAAEEPAGPEWGASPADQTAQTPKVRRVRTVRPPSRGESVGRAERGTRPSPGVSAERETPPKGKKGILSGLLPSKAREQPREEPKERKTRVIRKVKE